MILPVATNDVIYIMKGFHITQKEGKKPRGRNYETNIKMGTMYIYRSDYVE